MMMATRSHIWERRCHIEGFLTTEEVAERLSTNQRNVIRWCGEGRLPGAQRLGTGRRAMWLIPEDALQGFERPKPGPKPKTD
ncbi:MAG: helix-turn-helix domain-containing protein [Anaerolineae bacterium]|nr:helix-turn-helix domain-containing protein [Anaerolineae bacterium]